MGLYVWLRPGESYHGPPDTTSYGMATAVPYAVAVCLKNGRHMAIYSHTSGSELQFPHAELLK